MESKEAVERILEHGCQGIGCIVCPIETGSVLCTLCVLRSASSKPVIVDLEKQKKAIYKVYTNSCKQIRCNECPVNTGSNLCIELIKRIPWKIGDEERVS